MTIKQKLSIALWMLMFAYAGVPTANAQIPVPPDPSCAYCGVNLKTGEAHKRSCLMVQCAHIAFPFIILVIVLFSMPNDERKKN